MYRHSFRNVSRYDPHRLSRANFPPRPIADWTTAKHAKAAKADFRH